MRGSWSPCHQSTMAAIPYTGSSGRGAGDTQMMEMYAKYADSVTAREEPSKIKARLAALTVYADSQSLTGQAAFDGLRSLCSRLQSQSMNMRSFSIFYYFVFFMCREQGQKCISVSTAVNAWRLVLTGRFRLLDRWCAFVQMHQRHAISEDTWSQVLEFSRSVHEDLGNYDPEGAWPVLVDEFVDNMYRKNACPCSCKDTHRICTCEIGAMSMLSTIKFSGSSLGYQASTLPGMVAQVGSKRRWKDSSEEAAQVELVNCPSQRLERMPSPLSTKRMRSAGNTPAQVFDPMEGVDGDMLDGQDSWEQSDTNNGTNQFAQGSIVGQDPHSPTSTSGDDGFVSPSWQPWPSQGRTENSQWGQFNGSFNVQKAHAPTTYEGCLTSLSPQQDLHLYV